MTNVATLQTAADLSASITAQGISSLVPAGVVMAFAGATAPTGWLLCNGAAISRVTYLNLFNAIGTAHGYGDNVPVTGTFNLPDYRGRFIRGTDTMGTAASRDPNKATRTVANTGGNTGDNVGSVQVEDFKSHKHNLLFSGSTTFGVQAYMRYDTGVSWRDVPNEGITNTAMIDNFGGSETRPLNAYVNYIIKI